MIDSKKIKQMVDHVTKRSRGVQDRELMYPMREWAIGMSVTAVVVVVGAAVSYSFYQQAVNLIDTEVTPVAPVVPYDAIKISKAISSYQDRLDAYQKIAGVATPQSSIVPIIEEAPAPVIPEPVVDETNVTPEATTSDEIEVEAEETPAEIVPDEQLRAQ